MRFAPIPDTPKTVSEHTRTDTPIHRNRFQRTRAPIHRYTETGFSARVPTNVWLIESALTSLHYVCHLVESLIALI